MKKINDFKVNGIDKIHTSRIFGGAYTIIVTNCGTRWEDAVKDEDCMY